MAVHRRNYGLTKSQISSIYFRLAQLILNVVKCKGGSGSDWLRSGRSGDRIPVGARFSAPFQAGPGAHSASCTMGTGSFPEGKERPGRDADPSPPSSAVVMKE
jgi:hypothetical protein